MRTFSLLAGLLTACLAAARGGADEGRAFGPDHPYLEARVRINASEMRDFTLEAWVRPEAGAGPRRIVTFLVGSQTRGKLEFDATNRLVFDGPQGSHGGDPGAKPGEWIHLAAVSSGSTREIRLYAGGREVLLKRGANGAGWNANEVLIRIGAATHGDKRFPGRIARVGWYAGALSAAEIARLSADRNLPGPASAGHRWTLAEPPGGSLASTGADPGVTLVESTFTSTPAALAAAAAAKQGVRVALAGDGWVARGEAGRALQALLGPGHQVQSFGEAGLTVVRAGEKPWHRSAAARGLQDFKPDLVVLALGAADTTGGNRGRLGAWGGDLRETVLAIQQWRNLRDILLCTPVLEEADTAAGADAAVAADRLEAPLRQVAEETGTRVVDTARAARIPVTANGAALSPTEAAAALLAREILGREPDLRRLAAEARP